MGSNKKVSDIKQADYNPRTISKEALESLKKAMIEFGDLSGIVVNISTGNMVGGHQRIKHLDPEWVINKTPHKDNTGTISVGHIETPFGRWQYREVEWPIEKEKAANIAANKHGGDWDMDKLTDLFVELSKTDINFELTGFDEDILDGLSIKNDDLYSGMPEYKNENVAGIKKTLIIHFKTMDDYRKFAGLINQNLTEKTKSTYFPKVENESYGIINNES